MENIKVEESQDVKPDKQEGIRNADGTFKEGISGNLKGRPKGQSLKEYDREKFAKMSDEEKEKFLSKVAALERYKMAEGQPHQTSDSAIEIKPTPMLNALLHNHSDTEDTQSLEED